MIYDKNDGPNPRSNNLPVAPPLVGNFTNLSPIRKMSNIPVKALLEILTNGDCGDR